MQWIFEDRFVFEGGSVPGYTTDEKMNIARKDTQRLASYFFKDY